MKKNLTYRVRASGSVVFSQKGGIGTIIAVLATTVMVLGLVSYTILGQVAAAKETGDKVECEQQKLNMLLQNSNYVSGNAVKGYMIQATSASSMLTVIVQTYEGAVLGLPRTYTAGGVPDTDEIADSSIYVEDRSYDASGHLCSISFVQLDLSR